MSSIFETEQEWLVLYAPSKEAIFEIEVYGASSGFLDEGTSYKQKDLIPYKFRILKINSCMYELTCKVGKSHFSCGAFPDKKDAMKALNAKMKTAMKGLYVYRNCQRCLEIMYYPRLFCSKCGEVLWEEWSVMGGK